MLRENKSTSNLVGNLTYKHQTNNSMMIRTILAENRMFIQTVLSGLLLPTNTIEKTKFNIK